SVGYNKGFVAKTNSVIATLPIGHADGIGRQYGNEKGEVLIENKMAKIVGNVCMDMLMIDVTNIKCEEGDEVVFFDDKSYSAEEFSKKANTISYELISSISRRIKRVVSR
ncbi:alanine racemase, partial [Flavobacteriaceae bacterium]|nr:alanine racemase [Flavobacteriaceae bacterium]